MYIGSIALQSRSSTNQSSLYKIYGLQNTFKWIRSDRYIQSSNIASWKRAIDWNCFPCASFSSHRTMMKCHYSVCIYKAYLKNSPAYFVKIIKDEPFLRKNALLYSKYISSAAIQQFVQSANASNDIFISFCGIPLRIVVTVF